MDPSGGSGEDVVYVIDGTGKQYRNVTYDSANDCDIQYEQIQPGAEGYPLKYCFDSEFQKGARNLSAGLINDGDLYAVQNIARAI